ncbi:MAG: sugar phosphate nucleotidyltransferase [Actinomycetota bacterium]|nr:sugar phosphate nucleotidyltransferase [Actinomycetota bacterium]
MARNKVLAIIQAGGAGGRMDVLTRERAKPALSFAGVYQLVDFPLSNLSHSGIDDVWLSVQFQAGSLEEQVSNGRPWDLDRNIGGFRLLMAEEGTGSAEEEGFAAGNADELYRIRDQIRGHDPDLVIICSADHIYRFDFADAIATHRDKGAECTVVTTEVSLEQATEHVTVEVNRLGRVTGFEYKPSRASTGAVAAEIFVYHPETLLSVVEELRHELSDDAESGDTGLGDFGEHLLPRLLERGRVYAHALPGYWRDLGTPSSYLAGHFDVLTEDVGLFDDPQWPILSRQPQRAPARILAGALLENSLVSPGCEIRGSVHRSVLGPGVVVEAGASVSDSVLSADVVVCSDASVYWSIIDTGCRVERHSRVGDDELECIDADRIVVMGRDSSVGPSAVVLPGARLEPGTTA